MQKAGKATGTSQKQIKEHLTTNWVNWQQASNMTGSETNITERQFKSLHLLWYGVALVSTAYTSGKAPSMLKSTSKF